MLWYLTCIPIYLGLLANQATAAISQKRLDIPLFHSLRRIGTPQVSPNQQKALYTIFRYSPNERKEYSSMHLLDIETGTSTPIVPEIDASSGKAARIAHPIWFNDQDIGYMSNGVLYQKTLSSDDNNAAVELNSLPDANIGGITYKPATDTLLFTAEVYPDGDISQIPKHIELEEQRADSALVYDNLWARHWNKWMTPTKYHLFATGASENNTVISNLMKDLPACQDPLLGWEVEGYTSTDDGQYAAFVTRDCGTNTAWSTNVDIYLVKQNSGGSLPPKLVTGDFNSKASNPAFSPDGSYLAWLQMETPGYEADINRVYVMNLATGERRKVSNGRRDLSPQNILWSSDSKQLYLLTPDKGHRRIFKVSLEDTSADTTPITGSGHISSMTRVGKDKLLVAYSSLSSSPDLYLIDTSVIVNSQFVMRRLTSVNSDLLENVYLDDGEDFWCTGALGEQVHGWLLRPYGFKESETYPVALMIHGGPQQAHMHSFSYSQWNPNMYANAGFVTVVINFHGSLSYGQNFTDSIREQWGGYPYQDLMMGLDHIIKNYKFVDDKRMVALGGSYGGYMANWINGNTERFSALVAHDGQFDAVSAYYSTDELWFVEHDMGGVPFTADGRSLYEKYSPERLSSKFKTPTMFIHGANDFRLSLEQSLAPWTLLRRKGIPSRFVYFPDEDHLVSKVGNSMRWYQEVMQWITQWTSHDKGAALKK